MGGMVGKVETYYMRKHGNTSLPVAINFPGTSLSTGPQCFYRRH